MATKQSVNDNTASKQWASRPMDQRFLSLEELRNSVAARTDVSKSAVVRTDELKAYGTEEGELIINSRIQPMMLTNWSMGQVAQQAGAPGSYLRKLPSELAAECINHGLRNNKIEVGVLMDSSEDRLRAMTSPTYGRIWDLDVVKAVQQLNANNRWSIPSASYASSDPRRATTLYASDRDVFIFLVDDKNVIEVNGEKLFRGFYAYNSEVGAATFGIATFLYRYVCDNRIIWGVQDKRELKIKHTSGAPERFLREAKPALLEYTESSSKELVSQIKRAQNIKLGKDEDEVTEWLRKKGLTVSMAKNTIARAKEEEGEFRTPWAIANGMTAYARGIEHTDARVDLERQAGNILASTLR